MTDADVLRQAAVILQQHSRRKRSVVLIALCKVLTDTADTIEKVPR